MALPSPTHRCCRVPRPGAHVAPTPVWCAAHASASCPGTEGDDGEWDRDGLPGPFPPVSPLRLGGRRQLRLFPHRDP
jgi:hypothetical protein